MDRGDLHIDEWYSLAFHHEDERELGKLYV